ncbi:MAG: hypothetical protein IKS10_08330 [Lachnospiraceae bacterium]|nr:hypothetical protein [Lachnospiraceae bacterium]
MNYTFDPHTSVHSVFVAEDYFPAIIEYSSEELNNLFLEFNYKDTDMFELSVHPKTHILKRFSLTLCNHYEIKSEGINVPNIEDGTMTITGPNSTECEEFIASVYTNGLSIILSSTPVALFRRSGHLVFAFSDNNELVGIHLIGLTESEVSHIKNELTTA